MRTVTSALGTFICWDHDPVGTAIAAGEFWDQQIQSCLDEADPSGWALDLGADIGWFSVYLAQRHPSVLALEAHPGTAALLRQNVDAHGLSAKVTVLAAAAYDTVKLLHLAPAEWLGFPVPSETDLDQTPAPASIAFVPSGAGFAVPALPVDPLVHDQRVTLLKVDCQGADLRALAGLQVTIARCRPLIVFEFEATMARWQGDTWDDYQAFFAARDYTVTQISGLGDYVARPKGVR